MALLPSTAFSRSQTAARLLALLTTAPGAELQYVVVRWSGALGNIATAFPTDELKKFTRVVRMRK